MADTSRRAVAEPTTADVIIVGSGGGLAGALTARARGLEPLVVEKTDKVGGSTALSGGTWWAPANPAMLAAGVCDSPENGLTYLNAVVGDVGPSTSLARKKAYIRGSLELFGLLVNRGVQLDYSDGWPDYYAESPGGIARGRAVHGRPFDGRKLGPCQDWLRPTRLLIAANSYEVAPLALGKRTMRTLKISSRVMARDGLARIRRIPLLTRGQSMVGQMLYSAVHDEIPIWRNTKVVELLVERGQVRGVVAEREGRRVVIRSRLGVLLSSGGFAHNLEMRRRYQPAPVGVDWTTAQPGDTGEALEAAIAVGAATDLMDESWWVPGTMPPTGIRLHVWDRCFPHSLIVDANGNRYMNESAPYMEVGQTMLQRHREIPTIPSWLILESRHRQRYSFGMAPPRVTPSSWIESGYMKRASTIDGLAELCGIDADALRRTISRFNMMAISGHDADFDRGTTAIERYYGDSRSRPNPNLGAIERPPFYAVQLYPGDVGTAGGLVTDEHGRVLTDTGAPIDGLYAAGNVTASVMGRSYPAAGVSIGASMVFSYLAASHMAALRAGDLP